MSRLLIKDGFSLKGLIPAKVPLHDEIRFEYRPALPEKVEAYFKTDTTTPQKAIKAQATLIREHLISWDVTDENGNPVPLVDESFRRVPHQAIQTIINHISGYTVTDWGEAEKN